MVTYSKCHSSHQRICTQPRLSATTARLTAKALLIMGLVAKSRRSIRAWLLLVKLVLMCLGLSTSTRSTRGTARPHSPSLTWTASAYQVLSSVWMASQPSTRIKFAHKPPASKNMTEVDQTCKMHQSRSFRLMSSSLRWEALHRTTMPNRWKKRRTHFQRANNRSLSSDQTWRPN